MSNSAGRIIGMSLGGLAVAALGPAPLFAGNAVSFLAVVGALMVIHTHAPTAPAAATGTRRGPRGPALPAAPTNGADRPRPVSGAGSLGRSYQVTIAAMSDGPLHAGARGYGLLSTIFAVGTVLGGLAAARRSHLGYRTLVGAGVIVSVLQLTLGLAGRLWTFGRAPHAEARAK